MVLPLLALTWMSAVLAVTDRRSALFQILFAVFDSLEGFVIVMVHCILRREVGVLAWDPPVPVTWPGLLGMAPFWRIVYFPGYLISYRRSAAGRAE